MPEPERKNIEEAPPNRDKMGGQGEDMPPYQRELLMDERQNILRRLQTIERLLGVGRNCRKCGAKVL